MFIQSSSQLHPPSLLQLSELFSTSRLHGTLKLNRCTVTAATVGLDNGSSGGRWAGLRKKRLEVSETQQSLLTSCRLCCRWLMGDCEQQRRRRRRRRRTATAKELREAAGRRVCGRGYSGGASDVTASGRGSEAVNHCDSDQLCERSHIKN